MGSFFGVLALIMSVVCLVIVYDNVRYLWNVRKTTGMWFRTKVEKDILLLTFAFGLLGGVLLVAGLCTDIGL